MRIVPGLVNLSDTRSITQAASLYVAEARAYEIDTWLHALLIYIMFLIPDYDSLLFDSARRLSKALVHRSYHEPKSKAIVSNDTLRFSFVSGFCYPLEVQRAQQE
jgi:hypothetical protein